MGRADDQGPKFPVWDETDLKGWIDVCALTGKPIVFTPADMLTLSQPVPRTEVPDEHLFRVLDTNVRLDARSRAPGSSESEKGVPVFLAGKDHLIKGRYIPNRGVAVVIDGEEVMLQTTHEQRAAIAKAAGTKKAFGLAQRPANAMN